jgi:hypothetical protein
MSVDFVMAELALPEAKESSVNRSNMLDFPTPLHVARVAGGDGCVGRVQTACTCQIMQMEQNARAQARHSWQMF